MYINTKTEQFPCYIADIQKLYPNWNSSMEVPEPFAIVKYVQPPTVGSSETVVAGPPSFEDSTWKLTWIVKPLSDEEVTKKILQEIKQKVMRGITLTIEEATLLTQPNLISMERSNSSE